MATFCFLLLPFFVPFYYLCVCKIQGLRALWSVACKMSVFMFRL